MKKMFGLRCVISTFCVKVLMMEMSFKVNIDVQSNGRKKQLWCAKALRL